METNPKGAQAFPRTKCSQKHQLVGREAQEGGPGGGSHPVLEASREVAHEKVGLIPLNLSVLHRPLAQQGVEVHGQHSTGPLLISGRLLAWDE